MGHQQLALNYEVKIQGESMTHEVFISYSHHDKAIADGVCANLESTGIRCWIAPRDIAPGYDWPTSISEAIKHTRVFVLIFSSRSNSSKDVGRELILAANSNCIIVPFKIEDVPPEPGKEYYLARTHWLDAMDPPTQEQVDKLVKCVHSLLVEAGVELAVKSPSPKPPVTGILQPTPLAAPSHSQPPLTQAQEADISHPEEGTPASLPSRSPQGDTSTSPRSPGKKLHVPLGITLGISIGGIILLIVFFLFFRNSFNLPALSAVFSHPTPSSTLTSTHTPTFTPTPTLTITLTSTNTRTASMTIAPTIGMVSGIIKFGAQPFEGVTVKLCTDWLYTCRGSELTTVTNSEGEYIFTSVEPGEYQLITQTPDQLDETRWEEWKGTYEGGYDPVIITVTAGRKTNNEPHKICKHDLVILGITIVERSVTIAWAPYPGATSYDLSPLNVGSGGFNTTSTRISMPLSSGSYVYLLRAYGPDDMCVQKTIKFNMP
jgi:hypothetical protein